MCGVNIEIWKIGWHVSTKTLKKEKGEALHSRQLLCHIRTSITSLILVHLKDAKKKVAKAAYSMGSYVNKWEKYGIPNEAINFKLS